MTTNKATPEELARRFHETYERLAPQFGYETRAETKQFDPTSANGRLMIAVAADLIESQRNAVIEELVKRQAEDDGLWFNAKYATEAYLQDALRQLHKAVEALKNDSAVPVERQCES